MSIEVVDRPALVGRGSKYAEYYPAIADTVTSGRAIRASFTRKELAGIRMSFGNKYPALRLRSRKLPDGTYLWAEAIHAVHQADPAVDPHARIAELTNDHVREEILF